MCHQYLARWRALCLLAICSPLSVLPCIALAQPSPIPSILHRVDKPSDRIELTASDSRVLTSEVRIKRAQVNNSEILELTALSANQVQIHAKRPGVTQVNIWDENDQVHTIDIIVFGDVRELEMILSEQFPNATLSARALESSVVLSGFIDEPDQASRIIEIAMDYYPKVINNIRVGGVQQVLLHVKVVEVSRSKLRKLSSDFNFHNTSGFLATSMNQLINATAAASGTTGGAALLGTVNRGSSLDTVRFGIIGDDAAFFGFLEALERNDLAKIKAQPTLVTYSGRPAFFNSGGEIPILEPQSLGTVSIRYKSFGTQVDFVPIVLGNGAIRLEVRPRISSLDPANGVQLNGFTVPALRVREIDTGVEMMAGQTFALAGLIEERVDTELSGLPWLSDLPYIGVPFRKVQEVANEIELVILVTPELVDPLNADQVPACLPGDESTRPTDHELYLKGYTEVPVCCTDGSCDKCRSLGADATVPMDVELQQDVGIEPLSQTKMPPPNWKPRVFIPKKRSTPPKDNAFSETFVSEVKSAPNNRYIRQNNVVPAKSKIKSSPGPTGDGSLGLIGPAGYDARD